MKHIPADTRRWIYGIIAATVPLLVTLGSITGDVAGHLLNVAAAMLAIGGSTLAIANVSDWTDFEAVLLEHLDES
jgi:hypothetical protein